MILLAALLVATTAGAPATAVASSSQTIALTRAEALAYQRDAATRVDAVIEATFAELSAHLAAGTPVSEASTRDRVESQLRREKLVATEPPLVAFGAHSADPQWAGASDEPLKPGDVIVLEIAARREIAGAPPADVTWTAFAGTKREIPGDLARDFDAVRTARDRALSFLADRVKKSRPTYGEQVDHVARDAVRKARKVDYPHATGHLLGDAPGATFAPGDETYLSAGQCSTVEPGIYRAGKWGVRSGVDVCLDGDAAVVSDAIVQRELRALRD